jgi:membrane associated rhomboid family serine protease
VLFLIFLAVAAYLGYRVTTPEDRARWLRTAIAVAIELKKAALRKDPGIERFRDALRARASYAPVTYALAGLTTFVFVRRLFSAGALADPHMLMAWGGSFGPQTTNGEWWRLVTSLFVETGFFHVVFVVGALVQVGALFERLVGWRTFAGVYLTAGLFAATVSLRSAPVSVNAGGSSAVFGVYGLAIAAALWSARRQSIAAQGGGEPDGELTLLDHATQESSGVDASAVKESVFVPLKAMTRLVPMAVLFLLCNLFDASVPGGANVAGFAVGFVCGAVLTGNAVREAASNRRFAYTMGAVVVAALVLAVSVRGIADVRPEIAQVVSLEDRTTRGFDAAVRTLKSDRTSTDALAQLIERTIVPELEAADRQLKSLHGVPSEHQPVVADAEEYLRLRADSWRLRARAFRAGGRPPAPRAADADPTDSTWRLRAEAQHRSNLVANAKAEAAERESLAAFQKIKVPTVD